MAKIVSGRQPSTSAVSFSCFASAALASARRGRSTVRAANIGGLDRHFSDPFVSARCWSDCGQCHQVHRPRRVASTPGCAAENGRSRLPVRCDRHGIGMSRRANRKALPTIQPVDTSSSRRSAGTGLGLCISKRLTRPWVARSKSDLGWQGQHLQFHDHTDHGRDSDGRRAQGPWFERLP